MEIEEDKLIAVESNPAEAMIMSANLGEVIDQGREKMVIERVKKGVYTTEDVAYLAAMAEKRKRGGNEDNSEEPPGRRKCTDDLQDTVRVSPPTQPTTGTHPTCHGA